VQGLDELQIGTGMDRVGGQAQETAVAFCLLITGKKVLEDEGAECLLRIYEVVVD
jgi:hypothetical protein